MNAPASNSRLWQWLGGMGIVFSILFLLANVLFGSTPSEKASPVKIVNYYSAHKTSVIAGVFAVAVAALAFSFFLSALRRALAANNTDSGYVSEATLIGGAIYLGGLLLMDVLNVSLIDAAHHHHQAAAQTLNALANDDWVPVVVGLSIVTLSAGIAGLRGRTLPRWLGWASIVLGILAVSGPIGGIAFLLAPVWTVAVAIVLIRQSGSQVRTLEESAANRSAMAN